MKIFKHPNMDNFKCPVCGRNDDKPVVLIPWLSDQATVLAEQIHLDCIYLHITYVSGKYKMIFQAITPEVQENE